MSKTYRTDDLTRWGLGYGQDLDPVQVDLNEWDSETRLTTLEADALVAAVGISSIAVVGDQMTITMTDSTIQGPFIIPVGGFNNRGFWSPTTFYNVDDIFSVSGSLYQSIFPFISPSVFDPNATDGLGHNLYALLLATALNGIPAGGAVAGMVLAKTGPADFATSWQFFGQQMATGALCGKLNQTFSFLQVLAVPGITHTSASPYTIQELGGANFIIFDGGMTGGFVYLDSTLAGQAPAAIGEEFYLHQDFPDVGQSQLLTVQVNTTGGGTSIATLNVPAGYLPNTRGQHSTIKLKQVASNVWDLSGDLMPAAGALVVLPTASSVVQVDPSEGTIFALSPVHSMTVAAVPGVTFFPPGEEITLIVYQTTTTNFVIAFGSFYVAQGNLNTGTISGTRCVMKFVSDGTNMLEISRTAMM